ncbi:MAG: sulfatase-like hydrolase/transferase, partial [Lentisphaeria bacterium]
TSSAEIDNGHDASGPVSGGKYQIKEGGTRVPTIISWPKQMKPGKSEALISQVDFLGSFAALLKLDVPEKQAIDSRDNLQALLGKDDKGSKFILQESFNSMAIRKGKFKYINDGRLYDLEKDLTEKNNVAAQHPEVVEELKDLLEKAKNSGLRSIDK